MASRRNLPCPQSFAAQTNSAARTASQPPRLPVAPRPAGGIPRLRCDGQQPATGSGRYPASYRGESAGHTKPACPSGSPGPIHLGRRAACARGAGPGGAPPRRRPAHQRTSSHAERPRPRRGIEAPHPRARAARRRAAYRRRARPAPDAALQARREIERAPKRPFFSADGTKTYMRYAASPCAVVSKPSRSSSSLTRRPIVRSISLKTTKATSPDQMMVVSTPVACVTSWPQIE